MVTPPMRWPTASWRWRGASRPLRNGWRVPRYSDETEWMGLRGALGRRYPGADIHLQGAVPVGTVVPVYGSHLRKRAARVKHTDGQAAPSYYMFPLHPLGGEGFRMRRRCGFCFVAMSWAAPAATPWSPTCRACAASFGWISSS